MQRKTEEVLARWPYGHPTPSQPHMETISLEVIMATVFGVTDPARVGRLRSATLALLAEGHSRRFFLQTIIATSRENGWDRPFPRVRRAIDAVDTIVLEEVAQRRSSDQLDGQDVLGMFLRTPDSQGCLMTDDEICDAMRTLLLGGHDTTASTLTWILDASAATPTHSHAYRQPRSTETTNTSTRSSRRRCDCAQLSRSPHDSQPSRSSYPG